jgi:hypothetical protein
MTTSGTYNFNDSCANLTMIAFGRIGFKPTELTAQHLAVAAKEANLVGVSLSNRMPNLWKGQTWYRTLTVGQAAYILPNEVIAISTAFLTTTLNGVSVDRVIWPYSTFEYESIPNKSQSGSPSSYFYDRQSVPQVTLWPVPDAAATYVLNMRIFSQTQDATLVNGTTLDLPYRWLDVFVAGLAHRLSRHFAPDKEQLRKADYQDAWTEAATEDQEHGVALYIGGAMAGYFR